MRRVAGSLTLIASVALGVAPAQAVEKTVHVPIVHCEITVTTEDVSLSANWRRVTFERHGGNRIHQDCFATP